MVRTVGVIGAGAMGSGIAQLALQSGFSVRLYDAFAQARAKGRERILKGLEKGVARRKLTQEEADLAQGRLTEAADVEALAGCDIVVEAIFEDLAAKREVFKKLDALLDADVVLGTNTSSLAISAIAEGLTHPERLIGIHFFNPPVAMKLVEIIRHDNADAERFKTAWDFAAQLGRTPVEVKDTAGFLVNRVVRSYYLVAQRLAARGAGTFSEIDGAVRKVGKVPMGPFELMDFIGLEVNLKITQTIYEGLGRPERLKPHALQEKIVASGARGRKSGKGFYVYDDGLSSSSENPEALSFLPQERLPLSADQIWEQIMTAISKEADIVAHEGVATPEGVDTAVRLAMNFPKGPFEWKNTVARA